MPIDIFSSVPFHEEVQKSIRQVISWAERSPSSAALLAVFKAMFDRTQDWADIEAMVGKDSIDIDDVIGWVARMAGPESPRLKRLEQLHPSTA